MFRSNRMVELVVKLSDNKFNYERNGDRNHYFFVF